MYAQYTYLIFGVIKNANHIHYCTKNQGRGLAVDGDTFISCEICWYNDHISAYAQPMHLIFDTVIDIVSIFYHTKNQVGGLCVGGISGVLQHTFNFLGLAVFTATRIF